MILSKSDIPLDFTLQEIIVLLLLQEMVSEIMQPCHILNYSQLLLQHNYPPDLHHKFL